MLDSSRLPLAAILCLGGLLASAGAALASAEPDRPTAHPTGEQRVCGLPTAGHAACGAHVVIDRRGGHPLSGSTPVSTALAPTQVRHAYGFDQLACAGSATCGAGTTIAIVDAYDDPTIASDLVAFDRQYGLADPTFTKVHPASQPTPAVDGGWAQEISLDVEWAHAIAPAARILLEEAADSSDVNLYGAVDDAVARGATVVSMSWGGGEYSSETADDAHFAAAGVAFVASAGDSGHQAEYPAASPNVTAVGGTSLHVDALGNRTAAETAWSCSSPSACSSYGGTGGGVSAYEPEPPYQTSSSITNSGGKRAIPDVAYVADPNTGVSVYDSTPYQGSSGWMQIGGTSAGAPQWAALAAIAASAHNGPLYSAAVGSSYPANYLDITSGQNGSCSVCFAHAGYDEVTGLGSPRAAALVPALRPASGSLSFSGAPQTTPAGSAITLTLARTGATTSAVTAQLSTTSSGGSFPSGSSVTFAANATSATATYSDTTAGTPTITASAPSYSGAAQTETVTAAQLATLTVAPASAVLAPNGTQAFTASGADQYGNSVDASGTSWSAPSTLGTLSPATGTSSTLRLGANPSAGSVTASLGSRTATASVTISSTLVVNGGFENGLSGWTSAASAPAPTATAAQHHSGGQSLLLGSCCGSGSEPGGDSAASQTIAVPAGSPTLTFWYLPSTTDTIRYDWQTVQVRSPSGTVLATVMKVCSNANRWTQVSYSLRAFAGQQVVLYFDVHQDGWGDLTSMYVDDVSVQ